MGSLTAPGARAGLAGASPETRRSTPDVKRTTNMLSFFSFCGGRVSGHQAEGLAGALELIPQSEVVVVDRC